MIFRANIILSLTTGTTNAERSTGITKNIQRTLNIHNANLQDTSYRSCPHSLVYRNAKGYDAPYPF